MSGIHLARRGAISWARDVVQEGPIVRLSSNDSAAAANLAAILAAATEYGTIQFDATTEVAPISTTLDLPHGTVIDGQGHVLEVLAQGAHVLRYRGAGHQARAVTGPVEAGAEFFVCPDGPVAGFEVGDWVMVQSNNGIKSTADKSRRGNLRQIVSIGGAGGTTYTVDKPFGRRMFTGVVAGKVTLAPVAELGNVGFMQRYPEHSQFRTLVSAEGITGFTVDGCEFRQGGSSALELSTYVDPFITGGTVIHDLLDDEDGTGWWREGDVAGDDYRPNPRTDAYKQHYGYGISLNGGGRGGVIDSSCDISYVRHGITTAAPFTFQKMHGSWVTVAGDPEDFLCQATIHDTWSAAVSLHEQGDGIVLEGEWYNPGRLQAFHANQATSHPDVALRTNPQEDPNFYAARGKDTVIRNVTTYFESGFPQTRSSHFTGFTSTLAADLPRDNTRLENWLMLGGKYGIDTYQDITIDRVKIVDPITGAVIGRNGLQSVTGADLWISLCPNPITLHPNNAGVFDLDRVQFVSTTGTKIVNGGTVAHAITEGTAVQATGAG